jgi:hypothetical protein
MAIAPARLYPRQSKTVDIQIKNLLLPFPRKNTKRNTLCVLMRKTPFQRKEERKPMPKN